MTKTVPLYWGEGVDRIHVGSADIDTETGIATLTVDDPELRFILCDDPISHLSIEIPPKWEPLGSWFS